jgi:hypothetical protein
LSGWHATGRVVMIDWVRWWATGWVWAEAAYLTMAMLLSTLRWGRVVTWEQGYNYLAKSPISTDIFRATGYCVVWMGSR